MMTSQAPWLFVERVELRPERVDHRIDWLLPIPTADSQLRPWSVQPLPALAEQAAS
jgi:hypothetical protein